jgi:hypothetical protein
MNLKARKPFQIAAVSLAITMLASYVVYSQRQAAQTIAPGSKSMPVNRTVIQQPEGVTNRPLPHSSAYVASGSKSIAPVFTFSATNSSKAAKHPFTPSTNPPSPMLFPGSKSAAVFHPKDVTILMPRSFSDAHSSPQPWPGESFQSTKVSGITNAISTGTNATLSLKP